MNRLFCFSFLIFSVQLSTSSIYAKADRCPDDWEPYKEEKCFKLVENSGTQSFAKAEKTCKLHNSSKSGVVDNVWLGAQSNTAPPHTFTWVNGGAKLTTFTNWATGNPKNQSVSEDSCVQMHAEEEQRGQWSNEPCARRNSVVCEKAQNWSMDKMRKVIERISEDHGNIQETVSMLVKGLIPVGFIYTQLPFQKSPQELWPWMVWVDDSAQYDSAFFRVAGSKAAAFGSVQEEFSPYIDEIRAYNTSSGNCKVCTASARLSPNGGWTKNLITAYKYQSAANSGKELQSSNEGEVGYWSIHTASGEVRPRNFGLRIWKRIK